MAERKTHPVEGVKEVDFNSPHFQEHFKEIYKEIHDSGCPFAHSPNGDHYAVVSHEVLVECLRNPKLWRSKYGPGLGYQPEDAPGVLVTVDPPEHTVEANIAGRVFSKSYLDSFEPKIEKFIDEVIDRNYAKGEMDLHAELSVALPLFVIFSMFGLELGGRTEIFRSELKKGVGQMMIPKSLDEWTSPDEARQASNTMFRDHLELCRQKIASGEWTGEENMITRFLTTEYKGEKLSDEKIMGFCAFLLVAGSATTTILLSNVLYRLLSEPAIWERVKADPDLIPVAIEESLRIDSPVQGLFRTNDEETELGPINVRKDTKVMMSWAGANLDPNVFENPHSFDIDRDITSIRKHVAFGHGIHVCRGAPLARMEAQAFLKAIIKRMPDIRINGEVEPELAMPVLQGIKVFPVAWDVK